MNLRSTVSLSNKCKYIFGGFFLRWGVAATKKLDCTEHFRNGRWLLYPIPCAPNFDHNSDPTITCLDVDSTVVSLDVDL
jgi:hypothetical protein